jgi:hypothetical protein
MDVIALDATLVRGSHGRLTDDADSGPLVASNAPHLLPEHPGATCVRDVITRHVFER